MYIPSHFRQDDRDAAIAFMRRYPFALIVSNGTDAPVATHLPFHVEAEAEHLVLTAHFAKANPQWRSLEEALVIFSEPHAYVSPSLYEQEENVPTWNYMAVHAYGKVELVRDEADGFAILEALMRQSEAEYLSQWEGLSQDYKTRLFKGIVPFRIHINKIEAKEKLSQNKTAGERMKIIEALSKSEEGAAREIGKYMEGKSG